MKYLVKLFAVIGCFGLIFVAEGSVEAYSGVISIDSVQTTPGGEIGVPIRLSGGDEPISALCIPLKFSHTGFTADSVSFAGSILPSSFDGHAFIDNLAGEVMISYLAQYVDPVPSMSTSSGLLATIHFSISGSTPPGTSVAIDSLNIDTVAGDGGPAVHLWKKVHAATGAGAALAVGGFEPGKVVVKAQTGIDDDPSQLPSEFALAQNYPNPFNPVTVIEFSLPAPGEARLEVFNILGQKALTVVNNRLPAGRHAFELDASDLPSGIYFYRLSHASGKLTRKMTLIK